MLSQASSDLPLTPKEISFLTFWNDLRGDRTMPERSEIVPEDLALWIGWLHLVEVIDGGEDFLYRIFGSEAGGATGYRLHRKKVSEWDPPIRERALDIYRMAVEEEQPVYHCRFEDFSAEAKNTFSRIVVPLGPEGAGQSTHVLAFVTKHSKPFFHDYVVIDPITPSAVST